MSGAVQGEGLCVCVCVWGGGGGLGEGGILVNTFDFLYIPEDETLTTTFSQFIMHFQPFKGLKFKNIACPRTPLAYNCLHIGIQPPTSECVLRPLQVADLPLLVKQLSFVSSFSVRLSY